MQTHWKKFIQLTMPEKLLVCQVAILMVFFRIGLVWLNFQTLTNYTNWILRVMPGPDQKKKGRNSEQMAWAVNRVGEWLFSDEGCLVQALTAHFLFRRFRIPAELYIGVSKGTGTSLKAHAWLESEGQVVVGGSEQYLGEFTKMRLETKLFQ
jgi:hypothetical protein